MSDNSCVSVIEMTSCWRDLSKTYFLLRSSVAHIAVQGSAVAPSGCITQRKYKGDTELLKKKKKKDSLEFQLQTSNFHFDSVIQPSRQTL